MNRHAVLFTWDGEGPLPRITATLYIRADSPGQLKGKIRRLQEEYEADAYKILPPSGTQCAFLPYEAKRVEQ